MQALASFIAEVDPHVLCVHEIDAGDALVVATRFNRGWGYRGGQAIFWNERLRARAVHDRYLPLALSPLRPFERRGLLHVEASWEKRPLSVIATQFAAERALHVRELRYARTELRRIQGDALLFVAEPEERGFSDLGFTPIVQMAELACYARGFSGRPTSVGAREALGATAVATIDVDAIA